MGSSRSYVRTMASLPDDDLRWLELETLFRCEVEPAIRAWVPKNGPQFQLQLNFAMGRLQEGRGVAEFVARTGEPALRVLDIGAGNGGVSLGYAFARRARVTAIDILPTTYFARCGSLVRSLWIRLSEAAMRFRSRTHRSMSFSASRCWNTYRIRSASARRSCACSNREVFAC